MKRKITINSVFLFKVFTLIVACAGLISLALCQNFILAIYQLDLIEVGEIEIAPSLIMFIYILFGLVCVFQAIRTKEGHCKGFYMMLVALILEILIGGCLLFLYISGYGELANSKKPKVTPGIILNIVTLILYALGIGAMFVASHKEAKEIKILESLENN